MLSISSGSIVNAKESLETEKGVTLTQTRIQKYNKSETTFLHASCHMYTQ